MCGRCAAIFKNLHFEIHIEQLVPRQALLAQLGEERIGIELCLLYTSDAADD